VSASNILETLQVDALIEVRVHWFFGVHLLRLVVLVAAWLIEHLGDMIVLGCYMQRFGRVGIQIGVAAGVSKFQMARRMPGPSRGYGIDQSQGLARS